MDIGIEQSNGKKCQSGGQNSLLEVTYDTPHLRHRRYLGTEFSSKYIIHFEH